MVTRIPLLVLSAVLLSSCFLRSSDSESPVPIARFSAAYADLLVSGISSATDSLRAAARTDSLLASHQMTRKEFMATVRYCNRDLSRWKEVADEIVRLTGERGKGGPAGFPSR